METIPVEQTVHINANSQKRKFPDITADKPFMESGACPPSIKPLKQDEGRDCDPIPIVSTRQFTFQSHITSLYMIPTKYKFLPYQIKKAHHITYQKILQYKEPENYTFFNSKHTSPFTFNSDYLVDHTKIKRKLRNYDPLKQSFLFLPNENPKRPIIVLQEYLILNDDSLLQEDIPQCISDPLPPIQPIAFQPLGDCEKSSYYALAKKGYTHNELLFIVSHLISIPTKSNAKNDKKINQEPPKKPTSDTSKPESFPPTEEIQKYKELMEILKTYHNPK